MLKKTINTLQQKIQNHITMVFNFGYLSVLQIFTYALPLILFPYLVKVLGIEKYGLVIFAQSFASFFSILISFGFDISATKNISIYRQHKDKLTEIFSSVLIIQIVLTLFSFLLIIIIISSFSIFSEYYFLYYFAFLSVVSRVFFPIWYFQGIERMRFITFISLTANFIYALGILLVVKQESDFYLVPLLGALGQMVGMIASLYIITIRFNQKFKIPKWSVLRSYFIESSQFFMSRILVAIYCSANVFILGLFTNPTMVVYYAISEKMYNAFQTIYEPVNQVLYPYIAKERNIRLFKKIFNLSMLINLLGVIVLYFLGEFIFNLFFTEKIGQESLLVFYIFLIAIIFRTPSIFLGYPFLAALGYSKQANWSVVYGSLFHLAALTILSIFGQISIYSVAVSVVLAEIIVFLYRAYWVKKTELWQIV